MRELHINNGGNILVESPNHMYIYQYVPTLKCHVSFAFVCSETGGFDQKRTKTNRDRMHSLFQNISVNFLVDLLALFFSVTLYIIISSNLGEPLPDSLL